ncbi:hypothetical protein K474DRAFT_1671842 [Panus rudis PR-1116 ss-1]|nr:hypothetical protein K474DRAFT_1671842 [Panus rudis PR-1116 ss-1]
MARRGTVRVDKLLSGPTQEGDISQGALHPRTQICRRNSLRSRQYNPCMLRDFFHLLVSNEGQGKHRPRDKSCTGYSAGYLAIARGQGLAADPRLESTPWTSFAGTRPELGPMLGLHWAQHCLTAFELCMGQWASCFPSHMRIRTKPGQKWTLGSESGKLASQARKGRPKREDVMKAMLGMLAADGEILG